MNNDLAIAIIKENVLPHYYSELRKAIRKADNNNIEKCGTILSALVHSIEEMKQNDEFRTAINHFV